MTAGIKANSDGSAAIQVGGTDYITISSAGAVAIPVSLTIAGQPAGGDYALNSYVAPTTWTKPVGLKAVKVTVVGGGGNGGNSGTSGPTTIGGAGGGGGGGGAAILYLPAPSIPAPVAVTAGPGTNSFGAFCSATGGGNGGNGGVPSTTVGAGGAGGTGTVPSPGTSGQIAFSGTVGLTGASLVPGSGGGGGSSAIFVGQSISGGGPGTTPASPSTTIGAGAGGGGNRTAGTNTGGTGAPGIVIIEEFY